MPKHTAPAEPQQQRQQAPAQPLPAASQPRKRSRGPIAAVIVVLVLLVLAAACVAILVLRPAFAEGVLQSLGIVAATQSADSPGNDAADPAGFNEIADAAPTREQLAAMDREAMEKARTPIVAQCAGIDLHSPIAMADLTGILFHQSETEWALVIGTQLPEADYDRVEAERTMRINHDQEGTEGSWADTEALHLWRDTGETDMDTAIDIGALPGATVLSPIDGTVVLIRGYILDDEVDDIEIHIQPDGRPELDVVLIHTADPLVKAGDRVQAGLTPISHVRDIEKDLDDVQLGFFTPEGVGGNHTHLQVNDVNYKNYRELRLKDAIKVG